MLASGRFRSPTQVLPPAQELLRFGGDYSKTRSLEATTLRLICRGTFGPPLPQGFRRHPTQATAENQFLAICVLGALRAGIRGLPGGPRISGGVVDKRTEVCLDSPILTRPLGEHSVVWAARPLSFLVGFLLAPCNGNQRKGRQCHVSALLERHVQARRKTGVRKGGQESCGSEKRSRATGPVCRKGIPKKTH